MNTYLYRLMGIFFLLCGGVNAQFSVTTSPPLTGGNGLASTVYRVETNLPVIVDSIAGAFYNTSLLGGPVELWFRSGTFSGTPNMAVADGWTLLGTANINPINTTSSNPTLQVIPVPVNQVLMPGSIYYFGYGRTSTNPSVAYTSWTSSAQTIYTDGVVTINTDQGEGWGGNHPNPLLERMALTTVYYRYLAQGQDNAIAYSLAMPNLCPGNQSIEFTFGNAGQNAINSLSIGWEINGVPQPVIPFNQPMDTLQGNGQATYTITLGTVNLTTAGPTTVRAWTFNPNGNADSDPTNDTIVATFNPRLVGNYTLDPTQPTLGTNFQSWNSLATALNTTGVCGPVVVNVVGTPTLTEQVTFGNITGASAVNTVRILGNNSTITFAPVTSDRHIVKFDGASYITLEDLTIVGTSTTFGYGVHFTSDCKFDTIRNCTIDLSAITSTTAASSGGIVASGSNTSNITAGLTCSYCSFEDNTISGTGGTSGPIYGIVLMGTTAGTGNVGTRIINNTVVDVRGFGIRVSNGDSVIVENNDISRPNLTSIATIYYGIYTNGTLSNTQVLKNKVHTLQGAGSSTSTGYGLYNLASSPVGQRNLFANNLFYNLNTNGILYGIYASGMDNTDYVHNTIVIDDTLATTASATYGMFFTSAGVGSDVYNNQVYITRTGSGNKFGIYQATAGNIANCDYNNVFVNSAAGNNFFGYIGSNQLSQADFNQASGGAYQQNGITADPVFTNTAIQDYTPQSSLHAGSGLPMLGLVATDILNQPRFGVPTPGAFEAVPPQDDAGVIAFANPSIPLCNATDSIVVQVRNFGLSTLTSVDVEYEVNGVSQGSQTFTGLSLTTGTDTLVSLGQFTFVGQGPFNLVAYTKNPNGFADASPANDSSFISLVYGKNGAYTLDPSQPASATNYTTLQSFADDLDSMGVCGPVDLFVSPLAVLNEQVVFRNYTGASAQNRVHIHGQGAWVEFAPLTAERYIVQLNGVSHLIIDSLNVRGLSTTFGFGYHLTNNCSFDTIRNCEIDLSAVTSTTSTNSGGIIGSSSNNSNTTAGLICSYCEIANNFINGGTSGGTYAGIRLNGTTTGQGLSGTRVAYNRVQDYYFHGIYISGGDLVTVEGNELSRPNKASLTSFYGIFQNGAAGNIHILKNVIHSNSNTNTTSTSLAYPIYFNGVAPQGSPNIIANNLVYNMNSNGTLYAIYGLTPGNVHIYHNTVSIDNLAATTTSVTGGIYITGTSNSGIQIFNNNISIQRGGTGLKYGIYLAGLGTADSCDYNNIFMNSPSNNNYGFIGSAQATQQNFITASGPNNFAVNSVTLDPLFVNPAIGDFQLGNPQLDGTGKNLQAVVPDDILGTPRPVNPDPGAYEFIPPSVDAGIFQIVNPSVNYCPGTSALDVQVVNAGLDTITTLSLNYSINGIPQTPVNFSGLNLATAQDTTLSLGNITLLPGQLYTLQVYVATVNGVSDPNPSNDTIAISLNEGLAGVYTIDGTQPTSGTNFANFADLTSALTFGGFCGPVDVFVSPSTVYNEQVEFSAYSNASFTNRLHIHGQGATLQATPVTGQRHVIWLNGASFITIDSLAIVGLSPSFGYGVYLSNDSQFDTIRNCTIDLSAITSTTTTASGGIISSGSLTSSTTAGVTASYCGFIGNRIIGSANGGAYYGMRLNGTAQGAGSVGHLVKDNLFEDFYFYGAYFYGCDSLIMDRNELSRPNRTALTTFYGIYLGTGMKNASITGNTVHSNSNSNTASTSAAYGIYLLSTLAASDTILVANNKIFDFNNNGIQYGIYLSTAPNFKIYHNTIVLDNQNTTSTSATYPFYVTGNGNGTRILNNIIYVTRSGTGNQFGWYFTSTGVVSALDYNVVHMNSSTGNSFYGYYSNTNQTTRAAFQAATGVLNFEQNSSDLNPLFVNAANANFRPSNLLIDNMGLDLLSDVPTDYFGVARTATPDPGAIEFIVAPLDAGVVGLINPAGIACAGNLNVEVRVRNFGTDTLNAVSVDWEVNGTAQPTQAFAGLQVLPGQDTVLTLGVFTFQTGLTYSFKAWTFAPNNGIDASAINDTLILTLNPGMIGTYTVNSAQPVSAINFHSVVSVMNDLNQRGVCGAVVIDIVNAVENAQLLVGPIVGASAANTITFRSQAQDSTAVTLAANSTLLATNYVFRFSNASWINLEHLTLTNIGRVLDFTGNNSNIRVSNCVLLSDTVNPGTSNIRTPVYSNLNTPWDENITISNNRIVGGAFGVYWYGSANQANESDNRFIGNIFRQQNLRAAEFRYQQSLEFSENDLRIAYNSAALTYGVYIQDGGNNLRMNGNYMVGSGEHPTQSIRIENSPATFVTPSILSNNMLISGGQNTVGTLFHFHLTNSAQLRLFHNSATFNNPANGSGAVFADNMSDFQIINNNFASTNGNLAGYVYGSSIPTVSDNNNFFAGATASALWFNNNVPVADLTAWQNITSLDANSVSVDPQFFSATDLRTCAPALDGAGQPLATVPTDIDGNMRDALTPDIGATEFAAQPTVNLGPDITKCANESVTIGGAISGVTGYSWSTGASTPSISVQNAGTYTLSATGICGSASDAIQIINLPLPQALFTPVNIDPQVNFNNLSTGNGLTYMWDFGDGNQSTDEAPVHIYQQNGMYTVTLVVTDSCGLSSNASANLTIGNTSIANEDFFILEVWPNPTAGVIFIRWKDQTEASRVYQLQDMAGRTVLEQSGSSDQFSIDLSNLSSGTYLLRMVQDGMQYQRKLVKH